MADFNNINLTKTNNSTAKTGKIKMTNIKNNTTTNYAEKTSNNSKEFNKFIETIDITDDTDVDMNTNKQSNTSTSNDNSNTKSQNINNNLNNQTQDSTLSNNNQSTTSSNNSNTSNVKENNSVSNNTTDFASNNQNSFQTPNNNDNNNNKETQSNDNYNANTNFTGNIDNTTSSSKNSLPSYKNASKTNDETSNSNSNNVPNSNEKIAITNIENTSGKYTSEIDTDNFIDTLESYGLSKEDINRIINESITPENLINEISNDKDKTRKQAIMEATYLHSCNLNFNNMKDFNTYINNIDYELQSLKIKQKENNNNSELSSIIKIISKLKQGESLEKILQTEIVAWQYTDKDGNICYRYDNPYANLNETSRIDVDYKPLHYKDMYGNSENLKQLESILEEEEINPFFGKPYTAHKWKETSEQKQYFDEITQQYRIQESNQETLETELSAKITDLQQQKEQYKYIYDSINKEINYYFTNIDNYTSKDDFLSKNDFNSSCLNKVNSLKEEYSKYNGNISFSVDSSYQAPSITLTEKKDVVDILSCMINNEGNISDGYLKVDNSMYKITSNEELLDNYRKWVPLITDEEKNIFNYIYNTEGSDSAYQYLQNISDELDNRWLTKETQEDQEYATNHPILSSIGSIFVTPIDGISAICYSMNSYFKNEKVRRTQVYSAGDVWRSQVASDIAENYGENLSFLYSTGMSMADSATLIGLSALTGGTATPILSSALMGSRAYVSTLNDGLNRGLSDGSAIALAWSSSVVESAMESYSAGHLLNLEKKLGANTIKLANNIAKNIENETVSALVTKSFYIGASALNQGLAEGEEELSTEILNYISDIFISKDLSNYSSSINQYLKNGYTEDQAVISTMKDFSNQAFQAFLGGFVSGLCFGTFSGVKTTYATSKNIAHNITTDFTGNKVQQFVAAIEANRNQQELIINQYKQQKQLQRRQLIDNIMKPLTNLTSNSVNINSSDINSIESELSKNNIDSAHLKRNTIINSIKDSNIADVLIVSEQEENFFDKYTASILQSYKGYDYVIKPKQNLSLLFDKLSNLKTNEKILVEVSNINLLNSELISKIKDNVEVRISNYSSDFTKSLSAALEHTTYNNIELKQIFSEIEKIKEGIVPTWNNYQKAYYVYNYLRDNIRYEDNPGRAYVRKKQFDGLTSLIYNESTCQGFTHTYKTIMDSIGIPCVEVWGKLNNEGQHAYNIVTINGNSFIVDTTRESLNENSPGTFEGTGFGVQNIEQYSASSNMDMLNSVNTSIDNIKNNINYVEKETLDDLMQKIKSMTLDEAFEYLSLGNNRYGIDQGLFTNIKQTNPKMYSEMKKKMISYYKFKEIDVDRVFELIDSIGACTYARSVNTIVEYYKNNPIDFKNTFGFDLYKQTSNGNWYLNDAELLLDLYYWGNFTYDQGIIFTTDEEGNTIIDDNAFIGVNGNRIIPQRGSSYNDLPLYLKSKNSMLSDVITHEANPNDYKDLTSLHTDLINRLKNGELLSMAISPNQTSYIPFYDLTNNKVITFKSHHWIKITNVTDEGIIVTSWGRKCLIKYEDIEKNFFGIVSEVISNNSPLNNTISLKQNNLSIDSNSGVNMDDIINNIENKINKLEKNNTDLSQISEISNKSPEEIYNYLFSNPDKINDLFLTKEVQDMMNENFSTNVTKFTKNIINHLERQNITPKLINQIITLDDDNFTKFVNYNENGILYENDIIFERAISTGINFIGGLSNEIKLKMIQNDTYIANIKKDSWQFCSTFWEIPSEYTELFLDKANFSDDSVKLKLETIARLFNNKKIDSITQKKLLDISHIFDYIDIISGFEFEKIITKIKDKSYAFEILSRKEVFEKYKNEHSLNNIYKFIEILSPEDQIKFINDKNLTNNIKKDELNTLMNSLSSDSAEYMMNKYPKISKYLYNETILSLYLKTSDESYITLFKEKIPKGQDFTECLDTIIDNKLYNKFTIEEFQQIFSNLTLNSLLKYIDKIDDGIYKEYLKTIIDENIEKNIIWDPEDLNKIIGNLTNEQVNKIIAKAKFTCYEYTKIAKNLTKEQAYAILDGNKLEHVLDNIYNDTCYQYALEKFKNNPNIMNEISKLGFNFVSMPQDRVLTLASLVETENKIKFVNSNTLKNEEFKNEIINSVIKNPSLIKNVNLSYIQQFLNEFTKEQRLLLYDKIPPDLQAQVYSSDLSIEEKHKLEQSLVDNFYELDYYERVQLLSQLNEEDQLSFLNKIDSFPYAQFVFKDVIANAKSNNVLHLIFQKMFNETDTSDFNEQDITNILTNLDNNTMKLFRENCPDTMIVNCFSKLHISDFENELMKRFEKNPYIFSTKNSDLVLKSLNDSNQKILNNYINKVIKDINYDKIFDLLDDASLYQKFNFIYAYFNKLIDPKKVDFLIDLKKKNKFVLSTFNYQLFDETIYKFGDKLLTKLSKYPTIVDQLMELKNNKDKFNLFANLVKNDPESSFVVADSKMSLLLNYLLSNDIEDTLLHPSSQEELNIIRNIILKEIDQFAICNIHGEKQTKVRSLIRVEECSISEYYQKLYQKCDKLISTVATVKEAQNLIFNKYFSMSYEDASEIIRMYGNNIESIRNYDETGIAIDYLEEIYNILNNITTLEEAQKFYKQFDNFYDMNENLAIINEIKKTYTRSLRATLFKPTKITGYVEYEGQKIPVYEPEGNFQMLVQSTHTNYGGMPIINDNYFDSWNLSERTSNHGICCSLISNNNMGMALVTGKGIIIGFNSFADEQINMMAPYDIYTGNDGYVITCARPLLYLPGTEIMNQTRHTHNEFNLERTDLTGESKYANIQPDYVVIFEEMTNELKQNAYKASKEFNIPLVYISKKSLAIRESAKIDKLITEFKSSNDLNILQEILTLHENNRSGYRVSDPELVTNYFPTSKIQNLLYDAINNSTTTEQLKYINEFLKEEQQKFDVTYEATGRVNIIDIEIEDMIQLINNKIEILSTLNNNK